MIYIKAAFVAFLALVDTATVHAVLRGNRTPLDPTKELRTAMNKIRALKDGADDNAKAAKQNKGERVPPTENPVDPETIAPTALPTGPPTGLISEMPSMTPVAQPTSSPTSQPTLLPTSKPTAAPAIFDSTIEVFCEPDGITDLSSQETSGKTIICDANKPSCREAVTAVRESEQLQNFFGCAGDLGEGAARKLFNKYASSDILAGQLALVAATNAILVTERPDAMKEACVAIAAMQSPVVADPCCQGPSGCTSVTGSASNSPPFMTVAITSCTGDSACKDMGPNPLILDSSCTGDSACKLMNENEINPSITGVTFVGEMACTTPQSCEGVGRRSHGDVTIQTGACIGLDACSSAGRRVAQKGLIRIRSHIDIGANACVGSNACEDAHSTVNYGTGGKPAGSLTIGAGGCAADGSCEKMGLNDMMRTDIIVPPGGCGDAKGCRGCMTKDECSPDEFYFISDVDGACPKGGSSSGGNPTGDKVNEYCIGKDTLPTDSPTFSPTPFPTILTSAPTSAPTSGSTSAPTSAPMSAPTSAPTVPTSAPTAAPTSDPTAAPIAAPFNFGCLSTPGDVESTYNEIGSDPVCDSPTGSCANFLAELELVGIKGKMIKSIFGCNDANPPQPVTVDVAQERFNKIKNVESVTNALLAIAKENTKIFTGSPGVVATACGGSCCSGTTACTIDSTNGGVMTVTSGSCSGKNACKFTYPNAIILDSCKGGVRIRA